MSHRLSCPVANAQLRRNTVASLNMVREICGWWTVDSLRAIRTRSSSRGRVRWPWRTVLILCFVSINSPIVQSMYQPVSGVACSHRLQFRECLMIFGLRGHVTDARVVVKLWCNGDKLGDVRHTEGGRRHISLSAVIA